MQHFDEPNIRKLVSKLNGYRADIDPKEYFAAKLAECRTAIEATMAPLDFDVIQNIKQHLNEREVD
jgi:hypothetical protein